MNFISPQLDIHVMKNMDNTNTCLYFKFNGKFTKETSVSGSQAWARLMEENPDKEFEFVWDCQEMTGFDVSARKEWYNTMQKYKDRIAMVYVISNQLMIRSAAKVMLQFFGISSNISRSDESLPTGIRL